MITYLSLSHLLLLSCRPRKRRGSTDNVIVLSDEEYSSDTNSSTPHHTRNKTTPSSARHRNHHQVRSSAPPTSEEGGGSDVTALRELLDQEERKLTMLKQMHGIQQSPLPGKMATGKGDGDVRPSPRSTASKHSIVVVPGNQKSSVAVARDNTVPMGISSRLQQLVDSVSANQALNTKHLNSSGGKGKTTPSHHASAFHSKLAPPSIPSLTADTAKPSSKTLAIVSKTLSQITGGCAPPTRPSLPTKMPSILGLTGPSAREIITISDSPSPVSRPPPLLPASSLSSAVSALLSSQVLSVQVPTISSTMAAADRALLNSKENDAVQEHAVRRAIESSKRYKDYLMKQSHARRSYQKQIERKVALAPYPKTFRQVWPVIPVHDPSFVRNFGLEAIFLHLDPNWKAASDKSNSSSRVKPICNQCGCDFASAWQIRKSNSKQLLLCEACDFANLKILQRSKLSNQLKDLIDSIKKDDDKFSSECEEACKQVVALERQALAIKAYQSQRPPPLTSQLTNTSPSQASASVSTRVIQSASSAHHTPTTAGTASSVYQPSKGVISMAMKSSSEQPRAVIPSILQANGPVAKSSADRGPSATPKSRSSHVGEKRKLTPSASGSSAPPNKTLKLGSALDLTLNRLSQQLINRKLDEQRQQLHDTPTSREGSTSSKSPPSPSAADLRRSKRKQGKPRHKRHLSSSSATGE